MTPVLSGYDNYRSIKINCSFFKNKSAKYQDNLTSYWYNRGDICRPVEDSPVYEALKRHSDSINKLLKFEPLKSRAYIPKEGDSLYFDPACNIPIMECTQKWKRTLKVINADAVVVPDGIKVDIYWGCAIFVDNASETVLSFYNITDINVKPTIGITFQELLDANKANIDEETLKTEGNASIIRNCGKATCVYIGDVAVYTKKSQCLFDALDGVYPRIVCEKDLIPLLATDEKGFTAENIKSLTELLSSNDKKSVDLGMRSMAAMDYVHYPSICINILQQTEGTWSQHKPFNSAVKFMLNMLKFSTWQQPFEKVTTHEFDMVKDTMKREIIKEIESAISRYRNRTNLIIDVKYNITIKYPENPNESFDYLGN